MRRRQHAVPDHLVQQIEAALLAADTARAHLTTASSDAPLRELRAAHLAVGLADQRADVLLRRAVALAKPHSYREWSRRRHLLSTLSTARVVHMFAEQDSVGLLPLGSVRALDTGMAGPALGDLLHGQSCEPGATPAYGLDLEALLTGTLPAGAAVDEHPTDATVIELRPSPVGSTTAA